MQGIDLRIRFEMTTISTTKLTYIFQEVKTYNSMNSKIQREDKQIYASEAF